MKQQPPERTKRLAVIAAAAVILVMVLLIIETFRLLLPGLWTAFSSGDEQALSDYLTSEGQLRSFLTLWFLAFVQVVSLVIPAMPVQLAAGIAYGPWKGFVTSFSASVAANFLVFLLARRLAKVIELLTANSPKANKLLNSVRNSKNPWFYTISGVYHTGAAQRHHSLCRRSRQHEAETVLCGYLYQHADPHPADLPGRQLPGNGGLAVYCIDRGRYVCRGGPAVP